MAEQPTIQLGSGGSIPTSPLQFIVRPILFHTGRQFVERWHYSHSMGISEFTLGLFYNELLVGVITFGHPSGRTVACSLLKEGTNKEVWELRRMVLLDECPRNSESRFISIAIKFLRREHPHVILLVAFADCNVGHTGNVYKASGWTFSGQTAHEWHYVDFLGKYVNKRAVWNRSRDFGRTEREQAKIEGLTYVKDKPKNRYTRIVQPIKVQGRLG